MFLVHIFNQLKVTFPVSSNKALYDEKHFFSSKASDEAMKSFTHIHLHFHTNKHHAVMSFLLIYTQVYKFTTWPQHVQCIFLLLVLLEVFLIEGNHIPTHNTETTNATFQTITTGQHFPASCFHRIPIKVIFCVHIKYLQRLRE